MKKKKMKIKCLITYMCRGVDQDDLRTLGLAWISKIWKKKMKILDEVESTFSLVSCVGSVE